MGLYHGEKLIFHRDAQGRATEVIAASVQVSATISRSSKRGETFRITPLRPVDQLRTRGDRRPARRSKREHFREPQLVELIRLDPTLKLDIRYATTNNFMGAVFYDQPRAFLQQPAAEALVRVHQRLQQQGYGLLIHDAYRPWYVTKMFWDATPDPPEGLCRQPCHSARAITAAVPST